MKKWFTISLVLLASAATVAQDRLPDVPRNMRNYFVVLLVRGPQRDQVDDAQRQQLMQKHLAYIRTQVEQKRYLLVGPFLDDSRIGGIIVTSARSETEARGWAEHDPEVEAGRLEIEVHPAMLPSLEAVRMDY